MSRTEYMREYRRRPEVIAARKEESLKHNSTEKAAASKKAWRSSPEGKAKMHNWYLGKRDNPEFKAKAIDASLKMRYGITTEHRDELLKSQSGKCAICQHPISFCGRGTTKEKAHVDHCHETGAIRGILCAVCNTSLGRFNDDAALLRRAADYLENVDASEA